jgi:hypothetical protein
MKPDNKMAPPPRVDLTQGIHEFQNIRYLGGCLYRAQHNPEMFESLSEYVPDWVYKFEESEAKTSKCKVKAVLFQPNTCTLGELLDEMLHTFERDNKKVSALVTVPPEMMKLFESARAGKQQPQ